MDLSNLSDEDLKALASNDMSKVSDEGLAHITGQPAPPKEPSYLATAAKTLDWPGGIARASLAGIANIPYAATTGKSLTQPEDVKNALLGPFGPGAPNSAEYMKRAGVPEGDKGYINSPIGNASLNFNTRDLGGLALDVASDPLTILARAKGILNPIDQAAESAGKSMYKSGLKKIDQAVTDKGAEPLSDLLLQNGVTGTTKKIQAASEDLLKQAKQSRDIMHQAADTAGATVSPQNAFAPALAEIERVKQADPGMASQMDALKDKLQAYLDKGPVPISQASEWKTNLNTAMPESAFDQFGRLKGPQQRIQKLAAGGIKNEIINSANQVAPGLGEGIDQANSTMQTLLAARKPLKTAAKSAQSINAITPVDAMLTGMGAVATHNPLETAALIAAKKAADLSKTTGFRTIGGQALINAGQTGGLTPLVNRTLIQTQSPWDQLKKNQNQ